MDTDWNICEQKVRSSSEKRRGGIQPKNKSQIKNTWITLELTLLKLKVRTY